MFRGEYEHSINAQGRVSLPARFRLILEEDYTKKLVLVGAPTHIEAYPEVVYKRQEEADLDLDQDDEDVWNYLLSKRKMLHEDEYDGQGRILIPKKMREAYGLEKEVVFLGFMNKILLFRPDRYEEVIEQAENRRREAQNKVASIRAKKPEGK